MKGYPKLDQFMTIRLKTLKLGIKLRLQGQTRAQRQGDFADNFVDFACNFESWKRWWWAMELTPWRADTFIMGLKVEMGMWVTDSTSSDADKLATNGIWEGRDLVQ
jgi:hypothetical protein